MVDRHGIWIRRVDKGHFRDITVEVATISASCALLDTGFAVSLSILLGPEQPTSALTFVEDLLFRDTLSRS